MIATAHKGEVEFYRLAKENFDGMHLGEFIYGEGMSDDREVSCL